MTRRRALAVAASTALLAGLVATGTPGASATPAPSPQQMADAQRGVTQAQRGLADVQVRAEQAAEAYNGAQVRADAAQLASAAAAAAAAQARGRAQEAQVASAAAQGSADAAAQQAERARQEHERAVQAVAQAQRALDQVASGAYRSGGSLALLSAMLDADPLTFATGREVLNRVDEHQKGTVDALAAARTAAASTAARADDARATAQTQAEQVALRAAEAAQAAAAAAAAASGASTAAGAAGAAAGQAAAAKQHAVALVDAAERALGSASANAADLAVKAEQARREAEAARRAPAAVGAPAPGSAAAVAISWAYSEIGIPYAWGGGNASGPTRGIAQGAGTVGFDCSGLTLFAYAHAGVGLGHFTGSQWDAGRHVGRAELKPGDLMFFATDTSDASTIHHVSIYLGNDKMIEAPHTGDVVKVSSAVRSDFIGGVRLTS